MATTSDQITSGEAAQMLGIDRSTLNRKAASGSIPHIAKLPGHTGAYLFDRTVIEALISGRAA